MDMPQEKDQNPLMLLQAAANLVDQEQKEAPGIILKRTFELDPSRERDINQFRLAASSGDLETVNMFLNVKQMHPGVSNNIALIEAAKNGHMNIVKKLLADCRTNPADQKNYAVRMTVRYGHFEIFELFQQHPKVDTAADNNYPIRIASINGYTDIVKLLLKNPKVDPTVKDNYPIRYASKNNHWNVVEALLKDHRIDSQQVLKSARKNPRQFSKLIEKLEKRMTFVMNHSPISTSNLQLETKSFHLISPVLTEPRLSPTIAEKSSFYYLQELIGLAAHGQITAINSLLSEHKNYLHSTVNKAFVSAAEHGQLELVLYFLREYPQVNLNYDDNASLKGAQKNNHLNVVNFLLSHGASLKEQCSVEEAKK